MLKRCIRCILPDNFPGINFDENGVCNYCLNHERIRVEGKEQLEEILLRYKGKGKRADCIQTYSGGRDSSYALLKLVKEHDMKVMAVTYDWGLMTPEAHRNWGRMKRKLGVEHIVIQPNIDRTLGHVKKNLLAWARRPHIGMWPILTLADKQAEYYINRVAKKYEIPLIVNGGFSGFERTIFKYGVFGINEINRINLMKLLLRIAGQYAKNPRYINGSLIDALRGWVTQFISRSSGDIRWISYFRYVMWNEDEIISTLQKELDWESAEDTILTWRTDDYTPPLYNYICYSMEGYTENDTLRSIQIREDHITREKALELVREENSPRWKTMMDYFRVLNLTREETEFVLNAIPKNFSYPGDDYKPWVLG